jgi:hypothetical protein
MILDNPAHHITEQQAVQCIDALMKTIEIALKVFPTSNSEYDALVLLRLAMDEIKAKVVVEQLSLSYG